MPIKTACPKVSLDLPADHLSVIVGAFSNNDLTAISRRPCQAAQRVVFVTQNTAVSAGVTVTFRGEDDIADTTLTVPPLGVPLEVKTPIKLLVSGGAGVEAHIYWHAGAGCNYNK